MSVRSEDLRDASERRTRNLGLSVRRLPVVSGPHRCRPERLVHQVVLVVFVADESHWLVAPWAALDVPSGWGFDRRRSEETASSSKRSRAPCHASAGSIHGRATSPARTGVWSAASSRSTSTCSSGRDRATSPRGTHDTPHGMTRERREGVEGLRRALDEAITDREVGEPSGGTDRFRDRGPRRWARSRSSPCGTTTRP